MWTGLKGSVAGATGWWVRFKEENQNKQTGGGQRWTEVYQHHKTGATLLGRYLYTPSVSSRIYGEIQIFYIPKFKDQPFV